MWRGVLTAGVAGLALLLVACLGGLGNSTPARSVARAAEGALGLPLRADQSHWLLRSQRGWCGARAVRFGGEEQDPAAYEATPVLFRTEADSAAAFARLTASYLALLYRDRINRAPEPFDYPEPLPGDASATFLYGIRLPPPYSPDLVIPGQLTAIRAGRFVILVDSVGVTPDRFVPAAEAMVQAARAARAATC